MSYVKSWTFAYNTSPTDQSTATLQAASFVKQLKDFLVAGGWTVTRSCDSVSVASSDLITDLTKIVWSAGNRSWIEMKSPEGIVAGPSGTYTGDQSRIWMTLHCSGTNVYEMGFVFHNTVPTGTADATHCPASTNQVFGAAVQRFLRPAYVGNAVFHFLRTSQGNFIAMIGYVGANRMPFALAALPMTELNRNSVLSRDYPYGIALYTVFADSGGSGCFSCLGYVGPWYTSPAYGSSYTYTWFSDKTAIMCYLLALANQTNNTLDSTCIGYTYTATKDAFSGDWPTSEMVLQSSAAGKICRIGKLADLQISSAPWGQGDVDNPVAPSWVVIGSLLMPTNTLVGM